MKQTAMQELLDFIENQEYNFLNKEQLESCNKIKEKSVQLLQVERKQIIDAWENGYNHGACVNEDESKYHGYQYYKENFKL
jgi:hypothetical protein